MSAFQPRPLARPKKRVEIVNLEIDEESGFTSNTPMSYKYGITMSESDVPEINISSYLVQYICMPYV